MKCPCCDNLLRVMDSKEIEKDNKKFIVVKLYCKTIGCPNNNGQPILVEEIEEKDDGNK